MEAFVISILIQLSLYLLKSWWLYMISKKLWDDLPWLAWIPVVQSYTYVKTWWKSGWWILWIILWYICFIIPWLVLHIIVLHWISKRTWHWGWTTVWLFFLPFILFPVVWYNLEEGEQVEIIETRNN